MKEREGSFWKRPQKKELDTLFWHFPIFSLSICFHGPHYHFTFTLFPDLLFPFPSRTPEFLFFCFSFFHYPSLITYHLLTSPTPQNLLETTKTNSLSFSPQYCSLRLCRLSFVAVVFALLWFGFTGLSDCVSNFPYLVGEKRLARCFHKKHPCFPGKA